MDERAIYHRYKASRWCLATGTAIMFIWFQYALIANGVIRWDFMIVLGSMALVKLVSRFYYKKTN